MWCSGNDVRCGSPRPTPPSPPRYRCRINCTEYPDSCINEQLYMAMADKMVADGYLAAGYDRVNIGSSGYAGCPRAYA